MPTSCIYTAPPGLCDGRARLNREHPLPRGLGNFCGQELLKEKICVNCNRCNGLDDQLLHLGPVALLRRLTGIEGGRRDIFYKSSYGHDPLVVTGAATPEEKPVRLEVQQGNEGLPLRHINFRNSSGETRVLPLPRELNSIERLQEYLSRSDLRDFRPVEFYPDSNDPDDFQRIADLCQQSYGRRFDKVRVDTGGVINAATQFAPPSAYRRAIAKIAFHFFLKVFPEATGFEIEFNEIKRLIIRGGNPLQFVLERRGKIPHSLHSLGPWAHILYADWGMDFLVTRVQLFAGFILPTSGVGLSWDSHLDGTIVTTDTACNPLTWVVHLGRNPIPKSSLGTRATAFVAMRGLRDFDGRAFDISGWPDVRNC